MDVAAVAVAVLALVVTVASFWWLHARRGTLEVAQPHAYAFANKVRLRVPLAFYNTGATALVVANLRLRVEDDPERSELEWITTRSVLRPGENDDFAYATPFAVRGRDTREVIADSATTTVGHRSPRSHRRLRLEAILHPGSGWTELASFDWWAPPLGANTNAYIAHRNEPPSSLRVPRE